MLGDQDGLFITESLVASRPLSQTSKISYNSTSKQNWRWLSDTVIISTGWNDISSNYVVSSFNINETFTIITYHQLIPLFGVNYGQSLFYIHK